MKRILLTNFHPQQDGGGGHTRYVRTILESDLRKEFEFGVAAPEGSAVWATGRTFGVPTFACDFPGNLKEIPQMIGAVRRFERIYCEWGPDLIHVNGSRDQAIVVLWKRFYGRRLPSVRAHLAVRCIPNNFYNRWSYQRMVDGHIYVGHSARNISWAEGFLRPPRSRVVPVGVDVGFWQPVPKDPAYLGKLGLVPANFVFGSHAGMGWHKRTDLFLRAAALELQRGARPFKILLKGKEHEIQECQRLARRLGLQNVLYVRHEPDPRGYLSVIDVGFILSESIEAISFAARELMAMGKPLISSNYAGLVENVDDGLNGRLVESGDVEGVAEAIGWFLDLDPAALDRLGRHAREKAERVFAVDKQIQGLLRFYRDVFDRAGLAS
ncbi:MAG: glycosyltransferase family 4 protein [candidate division NC10 bacterium]|nr:glycosyltransferase family 4 protein [candidate division NC10 bacterium]